eukprot:TRINITY_DN9701_c0_g1_i1.p1 TRINITY_DN9701_c0_g1~~TRINITY_DN9701_c0_g1_i1.p1  ORF type:complete len:247 (+),score=60.79 TRINITY_DN9701_c0_g1_i1:152-892(+)
MMPAGTLPPGAYGMPPPMAMGPGMMPVPGPCGMMPPGTMMPGAAPFPPMVPRGVDPRLYEEAALAVHHRLTEAGARHGALVQDLNGLTMDDYTRQMRNAFSAAKRENLDLVDWRVPRLMVCKDPKHNAGVPPAFAFEAMERKMHDGQILEEQLSREAYQKSKEELAQSGGHPPPEEVVVKPGVPFVHAVPNFHATDGTWQRRLELRSLDEAMRGDVSQPLPRPCLFADDMSNFQQGRYVQDDCPIA